MDSKNVSTPTASVSETDVKEVEEAKRSADADAGVVQLCEPELEALARYVEATAKGEACDETHAHPLGDDKDFDGDKDFDATFGYGGPKARSLLIRTAADDFGWFRAMTLARWHFQEHAYWSTSDGKRRLHPPRPSQCLTNPVQFYLRHNWDAIASPDVRSLIASYVRSGSRLRFDRAMTDDELSELERAFQWKFPPTYRAFLKQCYRPRHPEYESRLALTDWRQDEEYESFAAAQALDRLLNYGGCGEGETNILFNQNGELTNRARRIGRGQSEADLALQLMQKAEQLSAGRRSAPKLIPIANGFGHFYMFDASDQVCDAVVAFGYTNDGGDFALSEPCLRVVSQNLHTFLLRYFNGFSHQTRGHRGVHFFDFHHKWPLTEKLMPGEPSRTTHDPCQVRWWSANQERQLREDQLRVEPTTGDAVVSPDQMPFWGPMCHTGPRSMVPLFWCKEIRQFASIIHN